MDKIYSRKRIKIPQIKVIKTNGNNFRKMFFAIIIVIAIFATGYSVFQSIEPVFEQLCTARAQGIATDITNRKSSEVLAKYNYQDMVKLVKSEDGKNSILTTDIVMVNQIISDIAIQIQKELDNLEKENIAIPIGAVTGNTYFAGSGPKFNIKIISAGEITTDIRTEFKAAGINQTIYRIYLDLDCKVSILTSYKIINKSIKNQVLLVETVVVGEVPETYLELENIK